MSHLHAQADSQTWAWEDIWGGGDRDFNDLVFRFHLGEPIGLPTTLPSLSIGNVTLTEGDQDTQDASFTVRLSEASTQTVTAQFATEDNTAKAGEDYEAQTGIVSFAPGELEKTISVKVSGDRLEELTENFKVNLANANNALISQGIGIGTILDNDVNEAPFFISQPILTAEVGTAYQYEIKAQDPNANDILTISPIQNSLNWTKTDISNGVALLSQIPTINDIGQHIFEWKVEDADGLIATQNYTLAVSALLKEASNFSPSLQKVITIPATPTILQFKIEGLSFDQTDTNSIKDAFEVELVDAQGNSLVHTIGSGKTAFFNITEGLTVNLAPGVTYDANTGIIRVNLVGVQPNTTGNLVLRLVNNDQDTATQVRITEIMLENAPAGTVAPVATPAISALQSVANPPNLTNLADVTGSMEVQYQRTTLNEDTNLVYADFNLKNIGSYGVNTNLLVAIKNISDPTVQVRDTDGVTLEGLPYYDFTDLLINGKLDFNQVTNSRSLVFLNPNQVQFTYDVVVLAVVNRNPIIQTQPDLEIIGGQAYQYDVNAIDADLDNLSYRLLVAPQGMTIDAVTGLINWQTATTNIGNQVVKVEVTDGRGGFVQQSYTLSITGNLPNQPPTITSTPIVDARVKGAYLYDVEATDPDLDTLTYELTQSPTNMAIESGTGVIHWLPTASQLGLQDVTVKVNDGKGGIVEQKYQILVQQEVGNTAPIIISDPVTKVYPVSNIGGSQLFDLSKWSVVQYEFNDQPDASWQIESSNTIVEQKINADASILLSDENIINSKIEGTWRVGTSDDDDYIGFVFGYQDPQHFYLFDWKQADQSDPLGFAERGMSIKVVDANSSLTGTDLWPTNGNGQRVKQLFHNTVDWKDLTDYKFTLDFLPDQFTITVKEGSTIIESVTINDNTYTSGKFGFYNYSQSNVLYSGFTQQALQTYNYSYDVDAIDPDQDKLTYSLSNKSSGMTIDPDNGLITWATTSQSNPINVEVKVEDGRGGFDTQSFVLELADRNVDLTLADIHTENLVIDGQLLTVLGQVSAQIKNQGLNDLTDRFKVVFFEDRNLNQAYDLGTDTVLGETQVNTLLQAGQTTTVTTNLSGFLSFINSPIWGFVDADKVITETNENNNLAFSSQDCVFEPSGQFNPVVEWNKNTFSVLPNSNQVMMTPAVIDLNGDKIPDIVFSTFTGSNYTTDGILRAISGANGSELWTVTNPAYEVQGASGVAVGDIDNDGKPEIVAVAESGEALIAFEHDGVFKWRSPNFWTGFPSGGGRSQWGSASLADLNQDGTPEIVVGSTVLDNQGKILWQGTSVGGLGQGGVLGTGVV